MTTEFTCQQAGTGDLVSLLFAGQERLPDEPVQYPAGFPAGEAAWAQRAPLPPQDGEPATHRPAIPALSPGALQGDVSGSS